MKQPPANPAEARSEPRTFLDHYCSVEFSISSYDPVFQFRVRDVSPSGLGILVNKDSKALQHLKAGTIFEMTYNPHNGKGPPEKLKTQIRHITYLEDGPFKGHYLVGLLVKNGTPENMA